MGGAINHANRQLRTVRVDADQPDARAAIGRDRGSHRRAAIAPLQSRHLARLGRPFASVTACSLVFSPPFVRPIRRPR